jgi:hypothetical protein
MPRLSDMARENFPAGERVVTITSVEETVAKSSGNPQLMFKGVDEEGIEGVWWRSLTPQAIRFLVKDLVAAGVDEDVPSEEPQRTIKLTKVAQDLEGRRVHVLVTIEGDRTDVRIKAPADSGAVREVSRL